jgi:succinate-semialdehyde dehydrogenase / glutarate-semialdehyde dehydrogenase
VAEALARTVSSDEFAVLERLPSGLLIGGEWREAASGATFMVEDPAREEQWNEKCR